MAALSVMLPGEIWKPVPGFEGRYEVSNLGRVWSVERGHASTGRLMRPMLARHDYLKVVMDRKTMPIHRAVLSAFVRLPVPGEHGAHLNGDRQDNKLSNLKWVTPVENAAHKRLHGTHQTACSHHAARLNEEQVGELRKMRHAGWAWADIGSHFQMPLMTARGIGLGFTYAALNEKYPPAENHRRMKRAAVTCPEAIQP